MNQAQPNNLSNWDLSGQDLTNANLSSSILTAANLTGANSAGAEFPFRVPNHMTDHGEIIFYADRELWPRK